MVPEKRPEAQKSPKDLAREKLLSSGLDDKDAKDLGITWLRPEETAALDATFRPVPSIRIPYFTPSKRKTEFFRLRYLMPYTNGFDSLTVKRQPKYVQLPNSPTEVYWPPTVEWAAIASGEEAVTITEGELKAACASKHGFPTIGLGGVWSWRSSKRAQPIVPSLTPAGFNWKNRMVYICFDSDQVSNPDVALAQLKLCDALTGLGARPFIVALPKVGDGKTGLDDFIVARGPEAYLDLTNKALPFDTSRELFKMNSEIAYVRTPGLIVSLEDGRRMRPFDFTNHAFANRHYIESSVRADGSIKMEKKKLAPAWLEWEQRSELAALTYAPGQPQITPSKEYNLWKGWGCRPKKGDITPWKEHLEMIFEGEEQARRWFERWCAFPLQNPGVKMYTAAVIWGVVNGTGKSLIGYSLGKIYGPNFSEIGEESLHAAFNDWAEAKQFVMGDDVTSGERRQRIAAIDKLKNLITQQTLRINTKFIPAFDVPDVINYYFTSNHPDAFFLDDTDRRFFVHEVRGSAQPREYYKRYDAWLRSEDGPSALFYHLLHLDLGDFDPRAPAMMTTSKQLMISDNKSELASWAQRLREDPDSVLKIGGIKIEGDLFTNDQLLAVYDHERKKNVTSNGLGRELKKAGFKYANDGKVIKTCHGPQRLYVVRNLVKWEKAQPTLCTTHYNERFGDTENTGNEQEKTRKTERKPKY